MKKGKDARETFDLEELKQKMLTQKEYYENIIAKIPGHVFWKDCNGVFLGCNDQQATTLGLQTRHDVVGKRTLDMIAHNQSESERKHQAELIDAVDKEIMSSGEPKTIEEPLIKPDGSKVGRQKQL